MMTKKSFRDLSPKSNPSRIMYRSKSAQIRQLPIRSKSMQAIPTNRSFTQRPRSGVMLTRPSSGGMSSGFTNPIPPTPPSTSRSRTGGFRQYVDVYSSQPIMNQQTIDNDNMLFLKTNQKLVEEDYLTQAKVEEEKENEHSDIIDDDINDEEEETKDMKQLYQEQMDRQREERIKQREREKNLEIYTWWSENKVRLSSLSRATSSRIEFQRKETEKRINETIQLKAKKRRFNQEMNKKREENIAKRMNELNPIKIQYCIELRETYKKSLQQKQELLQQAKEKKLKERDEELIKQRELRQKQELLEKKRQLALDTIERNQKLLDKRFWQEWQEKENYRLQAEQLREILFQDRSRAIFLDHSNLSMSEPPISPLKTDELPEKTEFSVRDKQWFDELTQRRVKMMEERESFRSEREIIQLQSPETVT